jgi:thioesterase domain-containing protein
LDYVSKLQKVFNEQLPLSRAMGVKVLEAGPRVRIEAPLGPNHNHLHTAFGGSVYSLAVLAGWGWLWVKLREEGMKAHIVIRSSQMEYLKPIEDTLHADCSPDDGIDWEGIRLTFERKGKARVELEVLISGANKEAAQFIGTFVLVK